MKKFLFIFMFVIVLFFISLEEVSSAQETIGIRNIDTCVDLPQTCSNCTFNNITTIVQPNGTIETIETTMTKSVNNYNYTYCSSTNLTGEYIVNGLGDLDGTNTVWSYTYVVTNTGFELTGERASVFLGLLAVLIFLFLVNMGGIAMMTTQDSTNEYGELLSINKLKYVRQVLFVIGYLLLMAIVFLSSNVSLAYLGTTLFGNVMFVIFRIMLVLAFPMFLVWLIFIFVGIFKDKETREMIDRGVGGEI